MITFICAYFLQKQGGKMSATNDLLWGFINKKQYAEALELIQAAPSDLDLNEINKLGNTVLMALLRAPNQQHPQFLPLVREIIQSNGFTTGLHIHPKTNHNAFAMAILLANPNVIKILLSHSEKLDIIFSDAELQYAVARYAFKSLPQSSDNLNVILSIVRDVAIRHAIDTNNAEIFQSLHAAGDITLLPLINGTLPKELAREKQADRVLHWIDNRAAQARVYLSDVTNVYKGLERINADAKAEKMRLSGAAYEEGIARLADITNCMATA